MKTEITKPYIEELAALVTPLPKPEPATAMKEPQPAELDQDPGGGYNTIHDNPQT
jgi:hypothetical protein